MPKGVEQPKSSEMLRAYFRNFWLSIKDKPVNWPAMFAYLAHLTYSASPISIKLVELTRIHSRHNENRRNSKFNKFISPYSDQVAINSFINEDEHWFRFLLDPAKLIECIKQYHCVENGFFAITAVQYAILFYLAFKSIFHRYIIGSDQMLADYYADRFFPRVFHSYPDSDNLQAFMFSLCAYVFVRRCLRLFALIKNSIINRHGYKVITNPQSNLSAAAALELPLHQWLEFIPFAFDHQRQCIEDLDIKRKHLSFEDDLEESISKKSPIELMHFHNPITFNRCYGKFLSTFDAACRLSWARDWYVPTPLTRMDLTEVSWLVTLAIFGAVLTFIVLTWLLIASVLYELCTIASEINHDSCLAQLPTFLFSSRILRAVDQICIVIILMPQDIEGAVFLWDCFVLISRTRKVREALQENINYCLAMSEYDTIVIKTKYKKRLNRSIWTHIQMTRCIGQEFQDLVMVYSVYINVLLIGGGLLISTSVTEILVSNSLFEKVILQGFVIASIFEVFLSLLCSVLTEITVSIVSQTK